MARKCLPSIAAVLLFDLLVAADCFADGVEFHDLDFDGAVDRAVAEQKVVFIDFFTTWCVPCKLMDATTFKNQAVAAWLAAHTVALKVDAEASDENAALAERFGVKSYPNYVYVAPDGKVLDRIAGRRDADEFIADSEGILAGENAVTRAMKALAQGEQEDPILRMGLAKAYARLGRDEDALREFLWCFDEGNEHKPAFRGVRLSFLLAEIVALGRSHPPALQSVIERRDNARKRLLDGFATEDDVSVLVSINRELKEGDATLRLYDQVKDAGTLDDTVLGELTRGCFDLLVGEHRYAELVERLDIPARAERDLEMFDVLTRIQAEDDDPKAAQEIWQDENASMTRRGVATTYRVLVGAGMHAEAAEVARKLTAKFDDAKTLNALAWAGYRSGVPVEENLAQAREAFRRTSGEDIPIVDTFARVLAALGHREEAISVAADGLAKASTESHRETMAECLEYCREQPAD